MVSKIAQGGVQLSSKNNFLFLGIFFPYSFNIVYILEFCVFTFKK